MDRLRSVTNRQNRRRPLFVFLAVFLLGNWARAHDPGLSTATVRLETNRIEVKIEMALAAAGELVEIDRNHDGKNSREELDAAAAELQKLGTQALEVTFDGRASREPEVRSQIDQVENVTLDLVFPAPSFTELKIRSKWLATLQPGHRLFLSLQDAQGLVLAERLLSANADTVTVQLDPIPADQPGQPPAARVGSRVFADFLTMGVQHIWTGYDHLLFLFGLLIVTRNFKSSIQIITCFTIAHSITLALATLNFVPISPRFSTRVVEPCIAASIVYVGLENLWRGGDPKGRWLLTFAFGLIHGFGFASVLREHAVNAAGSGIVVPLVAFNLGVELGQVAIAAAVLPVIWKLRTWPVFLRRWVPACSVAVALLGTIWFVQRVWAG